jgi:hypothetical protein
VAEHAKLVAVADLRVCTLQLRYMPRASSFLIGLFHHLLKSLGSTTPSRHTGSSKLAVHSSLTGSEPAAASTASTVETGS